MAPIDRTLASLLLALLVGCAPTAGTLDARRTATPQPTVRPVRLYHDVAFRPGQASLSDGERLRLLAFVSDQPQAGDRLLVVVEPTAERGLADRRQADLMTLLRRAGLNAEALTVSGKAGTGSDEALVILDRLVVALPEGCRPGEADAAYGADAPLHSFGCTTAANLAAMADPADLLQGRRLDPGDGERAAFLVRSYRTKPVNDDRKVPAEIGYAPVGAGGS